MGALTRLAKQGICGLCHRPSVLQDSHLLPAGIYKFLRRVSGPNPNPIIIGDAIAIPSSEQVRQWFLCQQCEDLLNNGGERWILRNCLLPDGTFPLYTNLLKHHPVVTNPKVNVYDSQQVSGIDTAQLAHFAIGVFWRASATEWRFHKGQCDMGPYEEPLRRFVLGESGFPDNCALRVIVSSAESARGLAFFPIEHRIEGIRTLTFMIPGLAFSLMMAKHIPVDTQNLLFLPAPQRYIWDSDHMYFKWTHGIMETARKADRKGYLKTRY